MSAKVDFYKNIAEALELRCKEAESADIWEIRMDYIEAFYNYGCCVICDKKVFESKYEEAIQIINSHKSRHSDLFFELKASSMRIEICIAKSEKVLDRVEELIGFKQGFDLRSLNKHLLNNRTY